MAQKYQVTTSNANSYTKILTVISREVALS